MLLRPSSYNLIAVMLLLGALGARASAAEPQTRPVESTFDIRVDTSETPELEQLGKTVQRVADKWYPLIVDRLKQDGFTAPRQVNIIFKREMKDPAATGGSNIFCAAWHFKDHPDDLGAIVHELAHVAQSYPQYDPVWLVEGIADYVRFWIYEPIEKRPRFDPKTIDYRKGYQCVGGFLAWLEEHYDRDIVTKLNKACRDTRYSDPLFKDYTGKSLDELWNEFKASLPNR
ncbi:MAG: basic secretory protein-like protein [Bacillota bacterium]